MRFNSNIVVDLDINADSKDFRAGTETSAESIDFGIELYSSGIGDPVTSDIRKRLFFTKYTGGLFREFAKDLIASSSNTPTRVSDSVSSLGDKLSKALTITVDDIATADYKSNFTVSEGDASPAVQLSLARFEDLYLSVSLCETKLAVLSTEDWEAYQTLFFKTSEGKFIPIMESAAVNKQAILLKELFIAIRNRLSTLLPTTWEE